MAEVSIASVRKVYGSTEVIHDLSVKVNDGEFVVLVGPSGCGKIYSSKNGCGARKHHSW